MTGILDKKLYEYSYDVYSQNGEDGINKKLFEYLRISSGVVLEIGAGDGFIASNTANLWTNNENYRGILIENKDILKANELMKQYKNIYCKIALASKKIVLKN